MWRRMHSKSYYGYNCGVNTNVDESHPFIPLNGPNNGQTRTGAQVSATRQFNESPSFQRLANPAITSNLNGVQSNTSFNSLSRNRYTGNGTLVHQNNYSSAINSNNNPYVTTTMSRNHDEYSINTDPYLMYKRMPSAPPSNNNYMSTNYEANESFMDSQMTAQSSMK